MISNEHPENFERYADDPTLDERVERGVALLEAAAEMRVTSAAGTDLTARLDGAFRAGSSGVDDRAGHDRPLARRALPRVPRRALRRGRRRARAGRHQPHVQDLRARAGDAAHRGRPRRRDRGRRRRRRPLPLLPRRVRRPRELRRQPRRLRHEPQRALGLPRALRQGADQRHRGARVRRQLPLLDGRERERRAATRRATSTCRCAAARSPSTAASSSTRAPCRATSPRAGYTSPQPAIQTSGPMRSRSSGSTSSGCG